MAPPLVRRGLVHHWRVNLAVVAGVAAAAAVLGGALLVGESVRGSLRELALRRLGNVGTAVRAARFVPEDLAAGVAPPGTATAPVIAVTGVVTEESGGRRASRVLVYGVDDRYWALQGAAARGPRDRDALLGEALASALGAANGATLRVTLEKPSSIPSSSRFGRRDDLARTLRVSMAGTVSAADGGELSLDPRQQAVRAVFVPLALLQRTLEQPGRVDTALVAAGPSAEAVAERVRASASLEAMGLRVRAVEGGRASAIEAAAGLVDDATAEAARAAAADTGGSASGVLTYLANSIRANGRDVPYSVVAAVDGSLFAGLGVPAPTKDPSAQPDPSTGPSGAASGTAVPGAPTPDELKQASLVRLCRSWQATRDNPNAKALTAEELRTLLNAAGGDAALPGYCERLLASAVAPDPSGGPDPAKTANKGGHGPPERTPDPDRTKSTGKPSTPADPNRRPSDHG
jgi:hypothetical protein